MLDIITLIEKTPMTRLSNDYQSRLLNKIKATFTDVQQTLFVSSFYCYLNFNSKNDFVINLDDVWKWTGFSRKDAAKKLLVKNFIQDLDFKIFAPSESGAKIEEVSDGRGGQNKERVMMTINTFKKFCMKAGTKKADEIHDYYIKLEELLQETTDEENQELRLQLKNTNEEKTQELKMQKHKILVEKFKGKKCVYIAEIEKGKFIKIGSSDSIDQRRETLARQFGKCIFLDIYECENFRQLESNILRDKRIKENLYQDLINGSKSTEIVLLSENLNEKQLLAIARDYKENFISLSIEDIQENKRLDIRDKTIDLISKLIDRGNSEQESIKLIQEISNTIENASSIFFKECQNSKLNTSDNFDYNEKTYNYEPNNSLTYYNTNIETIIKGRPPKGRKVQKIDPDNFSNIIKVYDSMIYALRDPDNVGMNKPSIQNAIRDNKIYKGFRWDFVEKGDDPGVSKIGPTKNGQQKYIEVNTIVKINSDKTKILDTFRTLKFAAKNMGVGINKMRKTIDAGLILNNCYFIRIVDCPKILLEQYDKPIDKIQYANSKPIKQIHSITGNTMIFNTLSEINIKFGVSTSTIIEAIETGLVCNGFYWEFVDKNTN